MVYKEVTWLTCGCMRNRWGVKKAELHDIGDEAKCPLHPGVQTVNRVRYRGQ